MKRNTHEQFRQLWNWHIESLHGKVSGKNGTWRDTSGASDMLELLCPLIFLALGDDAPSLRLCSSYLSDRILSRIGTLMQKLCAVHSFALTIPADHKRASMSFPGIEVLCINANVFSIWARSCIALHYSASNWLTPKKRACERDLQLSNLGQRSKCRISFSLLQL